MATNAKERMLARLARSWDELLAAIAELPDEALMRPGVTGQWSVKEILAHVTTWEEEALAMLPLTLRDERLPRYRDQYGGINAFNALMTERKRALSLAEVRAQLAATHARLLAYLDEVPEEAFATGTRFRRRLEADTVGHYPEHTRAITAWKASASSDQ